MKLSELVRWLKLLADKVSFKREIKNMLDDQEKDTRKVIDANRGILEVQWPEKLGSPKWKTIEISFDSHILGTTKNFINKPAKYIVPEIKRANTLIEDLDIAINLASADSYYENFPKYLEALELTKKAIVETVEKINLQKSKRGNPNWQGLSPAEKAKMISCANDLLCQFPEKYNPREGSYVSEQLKTNVYEYLKEEINNLSRHKVARVLLEYYQAKKSD